MPAFAVLSNRTMVEFSLENQVLTVYTDTEMTKKLAGGPEVEQALSSVCGAQYGGPITVRWKLKSERATKQPKAAQDAPLGVRQAQAEKKQSGDKMDALRPSARG